MYPMYGQEHLARTHQWELQREAEYQHQVEMLAPHRNIALLAASKLGALLWELRNKKQVKLSPKPVTGNL